MVKVWLLYCNDKLVSIHRSEIGALANLTHHNEYKLLEKDMFRVTTGYLED